MRKLKFSSSHKKKRKVQKEEHKPSEAQQGYG
jgi:hypothetical protein